MINHVYWALLNSRRAPGELLCPWERLAPTSYTPKQLTPLLSTVRGALLQNPAWWDKVYDTEQLLSVVYSPRYEDYTALWDPRITPPVVNPVSYPFGAAAVPINSEASSSAPLLPTIIDATRNFPILRSFLATVVGTELQITSGGTTNTVSLAVQPITVYPDLQISVSTTGLMNDAAWSVSHVKRPDSRLVAVREAVDKLPSTVLGKLFYADDPSQTTPLAKFKLWYDTSIVDHDRIAGVVFAYVLKWNALVS